MTLEASSEPLPLSINQSVALVDPNTACVIDSYLVRIHCGDRHWSDVATFGREGQGPGEIDRPIGVVGIPGGNVGVINGQPSRFILFTPLGEFLHSVPIPPLFSPLRMSRTAIVGTFATDFRPTADRSGQGFQVAKISLEDGSILAEEQFRHPSAFSAQISAHIPMKIGSARSSTGITVVGFGEGMARYGDDGNLLGTFSSPEYRQEAPDKRDLASYREGMTQAFGRPPTREMMQSYAQRPEAYLIRGSHSLIFDSEERLWAATTRFRDGSSYLDVFRGSEFVGEVAVRDRLLGFDLRGAALVTLVERSERDASGSFVRALDWYLIDP